MSDRLRSFGGADAVTIGEAFGGRRNVLNAIRLVLASMVIVKHASVVMTGSLHDLPKGQSQLFGALPVDGFFAISGFLITSSWLADPQARSFLLARAARLFPAFWVCLVVTVVVMAPLARLVAIGEPTVGFGVGDALRYVFGNASLIMFDNSIGGTPTEPPYPAEWNASLWTLKWEFLCYLGVLVLGLVGLLTKRRFVFPLVGVAWVLHLGALLALGSGFVVDGTRFLLVYTVGVALYLLKDQLRITRLRVVLALVVAVALALLVPGYLVLGAPFLAYGLIGLGVLYATPRLQLRNDISYGMYIYGFPVQQLLAHSSTLRDLDLWTFSALTVLLTIPLATASWFLVERPIHRWAARRRRAMRERAPSGTTPTGTTT